MNKRFLNILNAHEKEERAIVASDEEFALTIQRDYENSEEILRLLDFLPVSVGELFADFSFPAELPVIPVRKSSEFNIRKHTTSMRPYFHDHTFYEMIYVHRGRCVQEFKNPDETLTMREKQACILRPGTVHALSRCGERDIILKIIIPSPLFGEAALPYVDFGRKKYAAYDTVSEQIEYYIFKLLEELLHKRELYESAIGKFLSLLAIELGREPRRTDELLAAELQDYFEKNIQEATLASFAAAAGYSEGYAGRMIKDKLGQTFSDLLGNYKLERAARLLEESDLSVEDISCALGYANASGFYKQFCGFYGMTPSSYRKMFR